MIRTARVLNPAQSCIEWGNGCCSKSDPHPAEPSAEVATPTRPFSAAFRPFRTTRTPRGRQRAVPVRPADRPPKLGPAHRHPRPVPRTRGRHRHARPARQSPRAGPRQPHASPLGRRSPLRETPCPGRAPPSPKLPNACSTRSAAVGTAGGSQPCRMASAPRSSIGRVDYVGVERGCASPLMPRLRVSNRTAGDDAHRSSVAGDGTARAGSRLTTSSAPGRA